MPASVRYSFHCGYPISCTRRVASCTTARTASKSAALAGRTLVFSSSRQSIGSSIEAMLYPMFTGIVERTVPVAAVSDGTGFVRLNLALDWNDANLGESVAVNGVCLTIAEITPPTIGFDVIPETLRKTNLGLLKAGDLVNVERSLRAGDRIDGHFVQGHVDGVGRLIEQLGDEKEWKLTVQPPADLLKYI